MLRLLLVAGLVPLAVLATGLVADTSLAQDSLLKMPISKRNSFNVISDFTKRDHREHWRNLVKRGGHRRQSPDREQNTVHPSKQHWRYIRDDYWRRCSAYGV